ncbi:MAG: GNAT family N-acetyltransferase [Janthinobacterium lividum]
MPDLLVPLYKLPPREEGAASALADGIILRRPNTFELTPVAEFIRAHFSQGWADETLITFARQPITSLIAIEGKKIVGFAAYESTRKAYFGPTGVDPAYRGRGIGKALLIESLWGLHDLGYAYGIIGAAGPVAFYQKTVGAIIIPDSVPGIYANLLR